MKLKNKNNRRLILISLMLVLVVVCVEIIPGYYLIGENIINIVQLSLGADLYEKSTKNLLDAKSENKKLRNFFDKQLIFERDNQNYSATIEKFTTDNHEFNLSVNSIKPVDKTEKEKFIFQRITISATGDFNNIYNYCRLLEYRGTSFDFEELNISVQKDKHDLIAIAMIDVLIGVKK